MSDEKKRKLMLDRETSHGGWPYGPSNSWIGNKPVNKIIYDYLKSMGLIDDVPHGKLSETRIRSLIKMSLKRNLK